MKKNLFLMIVLLYAVVQGAWADTYDYPEKTKPEFHAEYSGTFWGNGHTITYGLVACFVTEVETARK